MNAEISRALGVSQAAVSQWLSVVEREEPEALRSRTHHGRRPKLTPLQMRQIPELLWHGAEAYGFRGEVSSGVNAIRIGPPADREITPVG